MLDDDFVAILICPRSKQPLVYFPPGAAERRSEAPSSGAPTETAGASGDEAEGFLLSPAARLRYRIAAGVPVLLPEEAVTLTAQETATLVERARALGLRVST